MSGKAINFRQLPNAAFATAEITGEGYRVLAAVQYFDRGGLNGRGCDATISNLATKALCDTRTTQRWLKLLVGLDLLAVETRVGRGKTNIYRVIYEGEVPASKGDSVVTLYPERVTAEAIKGDSKNDIVERNQGGYESKDTEGYTRRIHTRERASFFQENDDNMHSEMALAASAAFPTEAPAFIDDQGEINLCGFLSMMDRKARNAILSASELESLLDLAAKVFESTENNSPEYGLAYRLIQTEHSSEDELRGIGR